LTELVFRSDPYLAACEARVIAVRGDAVELDRTVFYPTGGGQPGDTGRIGDWRVLDTRKGDAPDSVLHIVEPGSRLAVGSVVRIEIDWERRHRHMRFHTALHLLVKTMSVAPPRGEGRVRLLEIPGVDLQACGGTHVRNTAEIGRVAVARIRSEGRRNKRVTLVFS